MKLDSFSNISNYISSGEIVDEALQSSYTSIEESLHRKATDFEKSIITSSLIFSLTHIRTYGYPNVLGRASGIFAFLAMDGLFESNSLPSLKKSLNLPHSMITNHIEKALDKSIDEDYQSSAIRSVIIGTRSALYDISGMSNYDLNHNRTALALHYLLSDNGFSHVPEHLREDTKNLTSIMTLAIKNGWKSTFDDIFSQC